MTNRNCEICRGAGKIRLPVHKPMNFTDPISSKVSIDDISREYPCPECSDQVLQNQVSLVEYHSSVVSYIKGSDFVDYAKKNAAHILAYKLLEDGFITFVRGPDNLDDFTFELRATIGVVLPKHVAAIEEKVTQHQEELAEEVVEEAIHQIDLWRSAFADETIRKSDAINFVKSSIPIVLRKRAARRVV